MSEVRRKRFWLGSSFRIYGKWIRRSGVVSSVLMMLFLFAFVAPVIPANEEVEAAPTASTSTITMTTGHANAEVDLTVNDIDGTFAKSSSEQTAQFSVSSDNYYGYTLSIAGTDDTKQLTNEQFGETLGVLDSITSAISESSFSSSSTYNGKWGYMPSKYNSSTNSSFRPAPSTGSGAQTLDSTTSAVTRSYTIAVGARADHSKPIGTYTGTMILTVTAKPTNYTINFSDNTGDAVDNLPSQMTGSVASATYVSLPSTKPERYGYVFKSWCQGTVSNKGMNCSGTTYSAGGSFPISQTIANNVTLYATWYPALQYIDDSLCTTTALTAADNRDGRTYTIKRMADGRCWMMNNLNLGASTITTDLTSDNTNLMADVSADTFNSWKISAPPASSYTAGKFYTVSGTDSTAGTAYGTLYNYYAATAGTISGNSNSTKAEYDICPAGWRLPVGGSSGEFKTLYDAMGSSYDNMRKSTANGGFAFTLSGYFAAVELTYLAERGYAWTQTNYNPDDTSANKTSRGAARAIADSSAFSAWTRQGRNNGFNIRCVKRPGIQNVTNLQEFKTMDVLDRASVIRSMQEQTNYTLTDSRDSKTYTIAKLKDGRVWMTQNLDLQGSHALSSSNTNLSTSITAANFKSYQKTAGTNSFTASQYIPVTGTDSYSGTPYGVLYNYKAATANTITGATVSQKNATYDLCPAGWRLPTGGSTGEFKLLYDKYPSNSLMRSPVANGGAAFALAGQFQSAAPTDAGVEGSYWSSTWYNTTGYYDLYISTSNINAARFRDRSYGYSIRCILKGSIADFSTLQEFSNISDAAKTEVLASMTDKVNYALRDTRDNQWYTVSKYYTGDIWMSENLNLGAKTLAVSSLTSANTNLSSSISKSTFAGWKKSAGTQSYTAGEYIPVSGMDDTSKTAYGTLYNYCAASAKTVCTSSSNIGATYDLCPAGWRLPTGTSSGEFQTLYNNTNYKSAAKMHNPIASGGAAFPYSGQFYSGVGPNALGQYGYFWSSSTSTSLAGGSAYLLVNTSTVLPDGSTVNRDYGHSIRCKLK